jgi:hypothetical protein
VSIEELDHLGEIRQRAGQPVHFVDHHDIHQPAPDVLQQALQRGALHGPAGDAAVIVVGLEQTPALTRLASDERLAGLALDMERIEVLLQAFLGRLAGVNGAAAS